MIRELTEPVRPRTTRLHRLNLLRWALVRVYRESVFVLQTMVWRHPANRGRRVRKVFEAVLFQLRGRVLRRPSVARVGERSRILAHLHVIGSSKALYANPCDWPEMLVWDRVLRPGDLFVDVGANVGVSSVLAAEKGAEVIAVEPGSPAVERLRENLALNGYRAEVVTAALGDRPGRLHLTVGLDSLDHLVLDELGAEGATREVEVTTLDEVLGDRYAAGVKIDVEGAESLVLAGAARALAESRIGLLQIEWNDRAEAFFGLDRSSVAAFLGSFDYELFRPDDSGDLVRVDNPEVGEVDVFAARRGTIAG